MLFLIARLIKTFSREKPAQFKPEIRFLATLDMKKVRPGSSADDTKDWLMKMGFSPTTRPDMWKVREKALNRLPQAAVLKTERLN